MTTGASQVTNALPGGADAMTYSPATKIASFPRVLTAKTSSLVEHLDRVLPRTVDEISQR